MKDNRRKTERYPSRIPAKIVLPVWDDEEIIEIPGTVTNISGQGLAMEIINDTPAKSRNSGLLWERVLSGEMLSILPIELFAQKDDSPIFVNGIITWDSIADSISGTHNSDSRAYQLGFRYYLTDEICQEQIRSRVTGITADNPVF